MLFRSMIPMFMMLSPLNVVLSLSLALCVSHIILKRMWYKLLFNIGQMSLAAFVGSLFGHSLNGAILGAATYYILTAFFIWTLFTFVLHAPWEKNFSLRFIMMSTSILMGIFMATNLALFPLIATLAMVAQFMYYQLYQGEPSQILSVITNR